MHFLFFPSIPKALSNNLLILPSKLVFRKDAVKKKSYRFSGFSLSNSAFVLPSYKKTIYLLAARRRTT
jgi:hypothetical protein